MYSHGRGGRVTQATRARSARWRTRALRTCAPSSSRTRCCRTAGSSSASTAGVSPSARLAACCQVTAVALRRQAHTNRFTEAHGFAKPNDDRGLALINAAAQARACVVLPYVWRACVAATDSHARTRLDGFLRLCWTSSRTLCSHTATATSSALCSRSIARSTSGAQGARGRCCLSAHARSDDVSALSLTRPHA